MQNGNQPILDNQFEDNKGLTKREYFAAMAMQSMACNTNMSYEAVAFESVKLTDALLAELDKPKNEEK